jgi:predicted kinase
MAPPLIHLICGSTGAGKTTYARELSARVGAVHFSIDQWMATLYWVDASEPIDPAWAMERFERCVAMIWSTAEQTAKLNCPCILDLGFAQKSHRDAIAGLASKASLSVQLHVLDVPADIRWARVQAREKSPADAHRLPFTITREMFDFVESVWQEPDEGEIRVLNGIRVKWSGS